MQVRVGGLAIFVPCTVGNFYKICEGLISCEASIPNSSTHAAAFNGIQARKSRRGRPARPCHDNPGCSKGLRPNLVTGLLAPRQNRPPCRPRRTHLIRFVHQGVHPKWSISWERILISLVVYHSAFAPAP